MPTEQNKPRALFIDRDGTLIIEPPTDFQVDSLEKLELYPGALRNMYFIARHLPFELVMVTRTGLAPAPFRKKHSGLRITKCFVLLKTRALRSTTL